MELRQPIEGDKVLSAQNVSSSGHSNPNTFSLVVNGVEHVLTSINSMGFGFLSFNSPVGLKGGDTVRLKSNIANDNYATTGTYTTRPTNFNVVAENATICNNTSPVRVNYNDIVRVFLGGPDSEFTLNLNGSPLSLSNFDYQEHQAGSFSSDGIGGFKGTGSTANTSALSKTNYPPSNELTIVSKSGYNVVRLGVIELIFYGTGVNRSNFATGEFDVSTGINYNAVDVFKITSSNSYYRVYKNNVEFYSFSKSISLSPTGGSISPNPVNLNTPAIWTLPVSPGNQTVTAEFSGGGVYSSTVINVDFCRATVDNKNVNATRGTNNNLLIPLTSVIPANCANGGFRIAKLPTCVILKLNSVVITLNQVISYSDRDKIRFDVPAGCSTTDNFEIEAVATGAGCMDSARGIVSFNLSACSPNWQNEGEPQCIDCFLVQVQRNLNVSCTGGDEYRNVVLGDGNCKDVNWNVGTPMCVNCQEVIRQTNTNPCFTGTQTRDIANPEGDECDTTPNWTSEYDLCTGEYNGIEYNNTVFKPTGVPNPILGPGDVLFGESLEFNRYGYILVHRYTSSGIDMKNVLDLLVSETPCILYVTFLDYGFTYEVNLEEGMHYDSDAQTYGGNATNLYAIYRTPQNSRVYITYSIDGASSCNLLKIYKDTNPCSITFGDQYAEVDGLCSNGLPKWVQNGDLLCNDCIPSIIEEDVEICSPTYEDTRIVPFTGSIETFYRVREIPEAASATNGYFNINSKFPSNPIVRFSYINFLGDSFIDIMNSIFINRSPEVLIELFNPIDSNEVLRLRASGGIVVGDPGEEELRVQTTKLYTSPNWWTGVNFSSNLLFRVVITIDDPVFNLCNNVPNYQPTGNTSCENCINVREEEDINMCSPSFGETRTVSNPEGTDCNYTPELDYIEDKCIDCQDFSVNKDVNPCSSTYNQEILVPLTPGSVCNLNSSLVETELEYTDEDNITYKWWINTNSCSQIEGEWREIIKPSFVIESECESPIEIEPCKAKVIVVNKCRIPLCCGGEDNTTTRRTNLSSTTSTTTISGSTTTIQKVTVKWGKVNSPVVTLTDINNAPYSGLFNSNQNYNCNFPYIVPEYLFVAEPIDQIAKIRWWENYINNELITNGNTWKVFGTVGGYRVYITSWKTFFSGTLTFMIS